MSSGGDLALKVVLQAQDMASGKLKGFGATLVNLAGQKGPLLDMLLNVASGMAAVGAQAVQAAADWQTSLNSLVTGANESQSNLAMVSNGMLKMAVDTGTSASQLAAGMYMIESGGYHGAQGLDILRAAAEGAKVGAADLGTVADATDTVLKNFGNTGLTATQAVNTLIATVSHGKTTMQDLSSALSGILPVASSVGVSLNDTAGAMSTMTGEGVPAAQAATFLRQMLLALNAPTVAATRQLKDVGLTTQQVSSAMKKSLPGALQMITNAVGKKFPVGSAQYIAALKNIMGGSKNLQGMLDLTGQHLATFKDNTRAVSDAVKKGGDSVNGWSLVQGSFNQKMAQAKESVETLFIKIGQHLLPILTKVVGVISPAVTWLTNFASAVMHNQTAIAIISGVLAGFVALILMLLVPAFIAWATAAWSAAVATIAATWPFLLAAAIIAAVVAIIILAVQHWGQIVDWLKGVWGKIVQFFQGLWDKITKAFQLQVAIFKQVWDKIVAGLHTAWDNIVGAVKAGLKWLWDTFTAPFRAIGALFQWLYNHNYYFKLLVDTIRKWVAAGLVWLQAAWNTVVKWLANLWNGLKDKVSQAWNAVTKATQTAVMVAWNWLVGIWNNVTKWLTDKWNGFADLASKAWQAVSRVFSSIWNTYIAGPLGDLWNRFTKWFGDLAKTALDWGKNLIQGFINGIQNMLGQVGQAASNVASTVAKFLGFHSPAAEGEGRFIIQWGSNMLKGFSSGVMEAIPQLQASVALAMKQGTTPISSPPALATVPYGRPPMGNSYSSYAGGGNHYGNNTFVISGSVNPDATANAVMQKLNQRFRRSGTMGNSAFGARNS